MTRTTKYNYTTNQYRLISNEADFTYNLLEFESNKNFGKREQLYINENKLYWVSGRESQLYLLVPSDQTNIDYTTTTASIREITVV